MAKDAAPPPAQNPQDTDPLMDLRKRVDQRLVELRVERSSWHQSWRDLAHHLLPTRGRYLPTPNQGSRGGIKTTRILDRTGNKAMERLGSFLMAGIVSPAREWMMLTTSMNSLNDDQGVKNWCSKVKDGMMAVLAASNFYNAIAQHFLELATFGTAVTMVQPDFRDVVRFYTLTAGEYFLGTNDRLEVDELVREYVMNVAQMVRKFGIDACSDTVRQQYKNNQLTTETIVVHCIRPNPLQKPGALGWLGKPFVSIYYEWGRTERAALRVEGLEELNFIAPRWDVVSNDAYGHGPGENALPDVKTLQAMKRRLAKATDKIVDPPTLADSQLENKLVDLNPGRINFISGLGQMAAGGGVRPIYQVPPNLDALRQEIQECQSKIEEALFNDLILMISQMEGVQPRNEMEITERKEEKMLMLGPMLERFHSEGLAPLVRIVYGIMKRSGFFRTLPAPPALQHATVEPTFVSVLAQAQKAVGTTGLEQLFAFGGHLIAAFPHVMDKLNPDAAIEKYAGMLDVDPSIIVPQKQVDAIRAQRQQQANQQQAMQTSMAAVQGANTLSQTDVGGGQNALQMMLGQAPPSAPAGA